MLRRLISVLAVATFACAHSPAPNSSAAMVIDAVGRDILLRAKEAPEGTYLLIATRTRAFELREGDVARAAEAGIPTALLEKLLAEQPHRVAFPAGSPQFRPVTSREIAQIFADGPRWDRFYARYPNSRGFVEFAGPVFNADATEALLYVDYNCYGDCGWGSVVHLQRQNGKWITLHEWLRYIS